MAPSITSMAISHPSLRWRLAFPRQSALLSDVTPRRAAERKKKPSARTQRGAKPGSGGCFVPRVTAPAAGTWPQCSAPRRAGLRAYSGHQPFPK